MFEKAARKKLRFNHKGTCTAEDLWDLKLQTLDEMYQKISIELLSTKQAQSLLKKQNIEESDLQLRADIIKHVVMTKMAEAESETLAAERRFKKEQLLSIIADKQNENLKNMSIEDLTKMIEAL